jgi:hypothetical protein
VATLWWMIVLLSLLTMSTLNSCRGLTMGRNESWWPQGGFRRGERVKGRREDVSTGMQYVVEGAQCDR